MKALRRRASLLALIAMVATVFLGSAYALWFEDLKATATAASGTLDGSITCATPVENELNPSWSTIHDPEKFYPNPGKNVASVVSAQSNGPHEYDINIQGAYPGYMIDCETHLTNTGTVPWHIEWEQIQVLIGNTVISTSVCDPPNPFSPGFCVIGSPDPFNPSVPPIFVKFTDFRGCQLHTNNDRIGSIFLGVNQAALEATTYTVRLQFRIVQWNESAWENCGLLRPGASIPVPAFP